MVKPQKRGWGARAWVGQWATRGGIQPTFLHEERVAENIQSCLKRKQCLIGDFPLKREV